MQELHHCRNKTCQLTNNLRIETILLKNAIVREYPSNKHALLVFVNKET